MRNLLFIGLFAVVIELCACTTAQNPAPTNPVAPVVCSVEQAVTSAMAGTISTYLVCTNLTTIQGDILAVLGKANLCAAAAPVPASQAKKPLKGKPIKGALGDIVCPMAIDSVMGLLTSKIPVTWGCSPDATAAQLTAVLTPACTNAVGI